MATTTTDNVVALSATNSTTASGSTVEGTALVSADSSRLVAGLDSTIAIASGGSLLVRELATTSASGSSVEGTATATAQYGSSGGLLNLTSATTADIPEEVVIGAAGLIDVTVDNSATATARSTAATAAAIAAFNGGSYGLLDTQVSIGVGGNLSASLDANALATASTVGPVGGFADATASASFGAPIAAIADTATGDGSIRIGSGGSINASAGLAGDPLTLLASAISTTGSVLATASATEILGIGGADTQIQIGSNGTIITAAVIDAVASASTVSADGSATRSLNEAAKASTTIDQVAALGSGAGDLAIGADALITALAASVSRATASSTDGADLTTLAVVANDRVTAIDLDSLEAGSRASISAIATSTQTANASTIGANGGATGGSALDVASASVADGDQVLGIAATAIRVSQDAGPLNASASLSGNALASNVNGAASSAAAGLNNSAVVAVDGGSIQVGNNLTGSEGLKASASSNLNAIASGVAGSATANAGSNALGTTQTRVIGIDTAGLNIGNSGTINARADSRVDATASSTGGAASAYAGQFGVGSLDNPITIANDGNVDAQANLVANALASTVGAAATPAAAEAGISLKAIGLAQGVASPASLQVGDTGNVTATALAAGGATAQTSTGSATADGVVAATGLSLADAAADVTIGGSGSVRGLALLGTLVSGPPGSTTLVSPLQITAAAVSDNATATGLFSGAGISGVDGQEATITAGPRGGDISGQVFAGANLLAATTGSATGSGGGDATATISPSNLYGIRDVNLIGGQATSANSVLGTASGDFNTTAISVAGNATGRSDVNAYGIFGGTAAPSTIVTNGGISAIARISNTVTASTVRGNATAIATSNVVGLSNTNIHIIGSGNIIGSAISNTSTIASSVRGRA